jgi:hypothetical protein
MAIVAAVIVVVVVAFAKELTGNYYTIFYFSFPHRSSVTSEEEEKHGKSRKICVLKEISSDCFSFHSNNKQNVMFSAIKLIIFVIEKFYCSFN